MCRVRSTCSFAGVGEGVAAGVAGGVAVTVAVGVGVAMSDRVTSTELRGIIVLTPYIGVGEGNPHPDNVT